MANTKTGDRGRARQAMPIIRFSEDGTTSHFCHDNAQAIAAVAEATDQGRVSKRFRARATDPAPIEIRVDPVTTCTGCQQPAHASETDDHGRCIPCMLRAGVRPIVEVEIDEEPTCTMPVLRMADLVDGVA